MESPSSKLALSKVPIPLEEGSQKDPKNPIPLEEERDPKKSKGPSRARKAVVPRGAKYSPASQLKYYGGSLITVASPVHFVYYGRWKNGTQGKGDPAQNLLRKFMASLAAGQPAGPGSVAAWWQLNSLYAQRNGQRVTKRVFLASEHYDWYSQGTSLKDDSGQVYQVVKRLFDKGALKPNPAAMYIVLTTPDVKVGVGQTGFCKAYCGWHDTKAYKAKGGGSVDVFYGFIGDPSTQCLGTGCGMQWGSGLSPNQQPGIDSMISTIGHELAEIATDPDTVTGWLTADTVEGYENADLCQFTVLGSKTAAFANGRKYKYNLEGVSGTRFFVQSNYDPVKGMCAMNP